MLSAIYCQIFIFPNVVCFQNEKRKMLMEHETQKIKEQDDQYGLEMKEWKMQLRPRKQVK